MLANNGDPDQTPCNAAPDLGLHRWARSQKWDARLIWVKKKNGILLVSIHMHYEYLLLPHTCLT